MKTAAGRMKEKYGQPDDDGTQLGNGQSAATVQSYQRFPVELLPRTVARSVRNAAETIGCDTAFIALPALSALAAPIGNTRRIRLKRGWVEPAVVWTAVVADSGSGKSPALDAAVLPIRDEQAAALERHAEAMARYTSDLVAYKAALTDWQRKGRKAGEPQPDEPREPVAWRCLVSDTTVEALAPILLEQPRGVLMARDELSGWLGSFNQYKAKGGGDTAHWLEMWRAGTLVIDRKTDRQTIFVPRAAVSVAGGIQPEILQRSLGVEHFQDGLAARLLLAMPPRRKKRWSDREQDERAVAAMRELFAALFGLSFEVDPEGQTVPVVFNLSDSGRSAWIDFYNQHAERMETLSGNLLAAYSKLEAYAARLALVVHCVRVAEGDSSLESQQRVDAASIEAGTGLVAWFANETQRIYSRFSETDEQAAQRRLIEFMEQKGGAVTVRDCMRSGPCYPNVEAAEGRLRELVAAGLAKSKTQQDPKGGRPVAVFRLKSTDTTPLNPEENEVVSVSVTEGADDWGEI